ncbi:restriction endonuclease subunit S [Clostridium sp. MSJ-8]|uniref:restriction endonuclease subunit S n=1 Tax=Clostridium sp. MSJ-8 TaxID=2841510 RepID=UPI001C0F2546|nr:restriction endonuclease subunit S [Clostridium sp. MSJ-8]MBU5486877.1 restriction endonuclease subunit S [Clostridium sp. MSJ-8]
MDKNKEKSNVPKIRFPGFTEPWEQRKLIEYLEVSKEKNKDEVYNKDDVLSVSGDYGIVNQIEFQGRSFAGASVANYGVVKNGDVVYTKSPLKSNPYGIIKTNKGKTGIVSTLYAVYKPLENTNPEFVQIYFEQDARMNNYMHPLVNKGAKNDMKVSDENALKGDVIFPKKEEQIKISEYFSSLDHLITLHQRKLDDLKRQKRGLLQKMFPKKGEKVPEIRFPEFTNDWEQRKLYEIAKIVGGGTPSTANEKYWDGDIDWYSPAEINDQIYVESSERKITELGLKKSSAKILPAYKTVLFTSRAGIGKMAILRKPGTTNQGFQSIVLNDNTDSYFVYSMGSAIKQKAEKVASGSTFAEISGKTLGNLKFMFPNEVEQKQIGEFFKKLDNLISLHQRKLDHLKELKKGLLQQMFV